MRPTPWEAWDGTGQARAEGPLTTAGQWRTVKRVPGWITATGRSRVAFSGYHGWHDWYLSANLAAAGNLDGQLLPGLEPRGVPRELTDTALPFRYNVPDELERWFDTFSDTLSSRS